MRVGSLFAGIGGFDLGFERAGFNVAWCVEWDKAAQVVLRRRFPNAQVYGDIREVDPAQLAPVDVICGGFPCQDLSVAGKRAGLAGERSGLFHDAMRIVRAVRPRVLILENVPGLLSSNRGLDFATVLREVGEGWDCAEVGWRVLDSQFFGVAQRRRRVFVVAGSRSGCAEEVLALAESCGGDPPTRGEARQGFAADAARGADVGRIVPALTSKMAKGTGGPSGDECQNLVAQAYRWQNDRDELVPDDVVGLRASAGASGFHEVNHPVIAQAFRKSKLAQSESDDETWVDDGLANTLNGFDTGDARTTHAVCFDWQKGNDVGNARPSTMNITEEYSQTLGTTRVLAVAHAFYSTGGTHGLETTPEVSPPLKIGSSLGIPSPPAVAFSCKDNGADASAVAPTLRAMPHSHSHANGGGQVAVATGMVVRRLTPIECERLQGFPDGWTDIGTDKPTADSHRYKQLGNAVTVNVAEWIGRRAFAWLRK